MKIPQTLALLVSLCVCSPILNAQEVKHAPTVEQCRADQRLWLSKLEEPALANVGYYELNGWVMEMSDCETVDPDFSLRYLNTQSETQSEKLDRVADFLRRHNLWDQFIAEDAQGKR